MINRVRWGTGDGAKYRDWGIVPRKWRLNSYLGAMSLYSPGERRGRNERQKDRSNRPNGGVSGLC